MNGIGVLRATFGAHLADFLEGTAPAARTGPAGPIVLLHGFAGWSRGLLPLERHLRTATGREVVRLRLGAGLDGIEPCPRAPRRREHRAHRRGSPRARGRRRRPLDGRARRDVRREAPRARRMRAARGNARHAASRHGARALGRALPGPRGRLARADGAGMPASWPSSTARRFPKASRWCRSRASGSHRARAVRAAPAPRATPQPVACGRRSLGPRLRCAPRRPSSSASCVARRLLLLCRRDGRLARGGSAMIEIGYAFERGARPDRPGPLRGPRRGGGLRLRAHLGPLPPVDRPAGSEPVRVERARRASRTATDRLRVGTGVTCPTIRIHPAIVAQAAATTAALMPGRFFLGVGTGENLNEHVVGDAWPPPPTRLDMLEEAIESSASSGRARTITHHGALLHGRERPDLHAARRSRRRSIVAASGRGRGELAGARRRD